MALGLFLRCSRDGALAPVDGFWFGVIWGWGSGLVFRLPGSEVSGLGHCRVAAFGVSGLLE